MLTVFLLLLTCVQLGSTLFLHQTAYHSGQSVRPIPKIIHQTWKNDKLPGAFQNWSKSWQECLPGWEYRLHTDEDNRNFIKEHFPEFLSTYDGYGKNIQRVDAVRYAYLAIDGGLYVDMDIECLKDPNVLFSKDENGLWGNTDLTLACEDDMIHSCLAEGQVSNAFMFAGSQAGKDFFKGVIQKLPSYKNSTTVLYSTGPEFLTEAYRELLVTNLKSSAEGYERVRDFHTRPYSIKRLSRAPTTVTMVDDSLVFGIAWDDSTTKEKCMNRTWCKERSPHAMSVSHWSNSWQPLLSTLEVPAKAHEVQHEKEDCYLPCNGGGHCDWCGAGNACCRYDFKPDPKECLRALHFSMPYQHVCVKLDEEKPKKAGFLQSAKFDRHEMCSCLANSLYSDKEPSKACLAALKPHLGNEVLERGKTFRPGMWQLQDVYERNGC